MNVNDYLRQRSPIMRAMEAQQRGLSAEEGWREYRDSGGLMTRREWRQLWGLVTQRAERADRSSRSGT